MGDEEVDPVEARLNQGRQDPTLLRILTGNVSAQEAIAVISSAAKQAVFYGAFAYGWMLVAAWGDLYASRSCAAAFGCGDRTVCGPCR